MVDITKTKKGDIVEVKTANTTYRFEIVDPKLCLATVLAIGVHVWIPVGTKVTLACLSPEKTSPSIIKAGLRLNVGAGRGKNMQTSPIVSARFVDPQIN